MLPKLEPSELRAYNVLVPQHLLQAALRRQLSDSPGIDNDRLVVPAVTHVRHRHEAEIGLLFPHRVAAELINRLRVAVLQGLLEMR